MESNIKSKVMSGLVWRYAERCGTQFISFVLSLILARLLTPSDYGLIGLITVFINIAQVFLDSGMGQALIQRKDIKQEDYSTVFCYSMVLSIIIYGILFFVAPLIGDFYDNVLLVRVIRVLAFSIVIGTLTSAQNSYLQREMKFKRLFWITLSGTVISGAIGILMAYNGFGVWALVGQTLVKQIINVICIWIAVKWKPKFHFSLKRLLQLFSYSWKLLCSSLLDVVYSNIYSLIIGKFYSTEALGVYERGKHFPMFIINNINSAIDSVLFPALSEVQDEKTRLKNMISRSVKTSTFLIFPAMAGLAAIAKPLTVSLLTEKWIPAVPFIQFCCFTYAFWPIQTANLQAIKAVGRSDIFLKLEIIKKIMGVTVLAITLQHGLYVMMFARCITTMISLFLNSYPNKKLLGYSYWEQVKDFFPSFLLSLIMCGIVFSINLFNLNSFVTIFIQVAVGIIVYLGGAYIFKFETLNYLLATLKSIIKKKKS